MDYELEGLRDMFAAVALNALIAKAPLFDTQGAHGKPVEDMVQFKKGMAESAYWYADAMLAARKAVLT